MIENNKKHLSRAAIFVTIENCTWAMIHDPSLKTQHIE